MRLKLRFRPLIQMARWQFLFVAAMFFLSAGSAQATNYFSFGAESATAVTMNGSAAPIYEWKSGTTRDCTVAHSGTCSMRLNVIGNDSGNQGMGIDMDQNSYAWNMVGSQSMYYRWWMKIQPGFSWGTGTAKTKSSRTGAGSQGYTGYVYGSGFNIGECASFVGSGCLTDTGVLANSDSEIFIPYDVAGKDDGQWHEYIVRVKPNTSAMCTGGVNCDAEFEAWVDGISAGSYNNWKLHNTASDAMAEFWGGWMAYPYFQLNGTPSDGGTMYIDDVSTDDTWNSTFSGGDTTPPAAPTGLGVQ
ncbi:MAG: hypothetical protein WBP40_00905 [Candidatus Moraniibacteriota bacterium]